MSASASHTRAAGERRGRCRRRRRPARAAHAAASACRRSARRTARVAARASRTQHDAGAARRPARAVAPERRRRPRSARCTVARHASSARSATVSRCSRRTLRSPVTRADTRARARVGRRGRPVAGGGADAHADGAPSTSRYTGPSSDTTRMPPARVLAERAQLASTEAGRPRRRAGVREVDRAQLADAVVAVQVAAEQRRQAGVAHDVAAGDRAEAVAGCGSWSAPASRPGVARGVARPPRRRPRSTASRSWPRARR